MSKRSDDELIKVALLMDNLKADELPPRLKSIKALQTIADFIGVERTRNELVPFLLGLCF
jgi:serine/threonine-protein phosphatase 2A regulatory subunit A